MIRALYNLGKVYEKNNEKESVLLSLLENPNENEKYPNIIKLLFDFDATLFRDFMNYLNGLKITGMI